MDIQAFENLAKANPYGLVRMKMVEEHTPYRVGELAGFSPEDALRRFLEREALPAAEDGTPLIGFEDAVEPSEPAQSGPISTVQIPDDWRNLHHLQRLRIAKAISGDETIATAIAADAIIGAEEQRRKGT